MLDHRGAQPIALAAEIADHIGNRGTIGIGVVLDGVEDAWPEFIPGPNLTNPMKLMSARDRLAQLRLRSLGLGDPLRGSDQPSSS